MAKRKSTRPAKSASPVAPEKADGVLAETGDIEIVIPLHALDQAPWNPKTPLHGVYRKGLTGSLDTFRFRDRLKVWPNPKSKGRYFVLDGNQRIDVIREMVEGEIFRLQVDRETATRTIDTAEVARLVEKRAKGLATKVETIADGGGVTTEKIPASPAQLASLQAEIVAELTEALRKQVADEFAADDARESSIKSEANSRLIPCRVLADMDADDAKAFTLAFDRNHAKYNENKVVSLIDEILTGKSRSARTIEQIIRPQRSFVPPQQASGTLDRIIAAGRAGSTAAYPLASQGDDGDDPGDGRAAPADATTDPDFADSPWGPPPKFDVPPTPGPSLIPLMFSVTAETYSAVKSLILKSASRLIREKRLKEALSFLAGSMELLDHMVESGDVDGVISEAIVEAALYIFNLRMTIGKPGRNELNHAG